MEIDFIQIKKNYLKKNLKIGQILGELPLKNNINMICLKIMQ